MFTQDELKLALAQMKLAQAEDRHFGQLAAKYVNTFVKYNVRSVDNVNPYGGGFELADIATQYLIVELSEYNDWHGTLDTLEKNGVEYKVPVKNWNGSYKCAPSGILDLSNDPRFATARQKRFAVSIRYRDPGFF